MFKRKVGSFKGKLSLQYLIIREQPKNNSSRLWNLNNLPDPYFICPTNQPYTIKHRGVALVGLTLQSNLMEKLTLILQTVLIKISHHVQRQPLFYQATSQIFSHHVSLHSSLMTWSKEDGIVSFLFVQGNLKRRTNIHVLIKEKKSHGQKELNVFTLLLFKSVSLVD